MAVIPSAVRALDTQALMIGVRSALTQNPALSIVVGPRVYPDDDVTGGAFPYITVAMPSVVPDYDYTGSRMNALVDVTVVDRNSSTVNVGPAALAIQSALLDTPWQIAGYTMVGTTLVGIRPYTQINAGTGADIYRYVAVTVRVEAERN